MKKKKFIIITMQYKENLSVCIEVQKGEHLDDLKNIVASEFLPYKNIKFKTSKIFKAHEMDSLPKKAAFDECMPY